MNIKVCHREPAQCCAIAGYWRELADAEQECNRLLREDRDELQLLVTRQQLTLREREKEIASLMKRKKPVTSETSYRGATPIRRRA